LEWSGGWTILQSKVGGLEQRVGVGVGPGGWVGITVVCLWPQNGSG